MAHSITTFLMFEGTAEEAINLYVSLFAGAAITHIERYGPDEQGAEGKVKQARFTLGGHNLIGYDSPIHHNFTFTPAISLFVECESEAELNAAFTRLSEGGALLMPLDNYGFSTKFAWVNDRFGVSWQLNLA
ncbi:MAG TPA: VOC family protein [Roseiflexaceae bacterium]|nr:VOC family protein [Roseiflexaceae bacterium]HMP42118.1 VOC family protein [Roseiflexaceae bacterium]